MKVWIINVGENLPTDGENVRVFRCGILADYLRERGHEVVWWTSTYNHYLKKHRYLENKTIYFKDQYKIRLLHGTGYRSNKSLKRLYDHWLLGRSFKKLSKEEAIPDIIISSFPIISLTYEASEFGKKNNVPVIIDVRDLWPDIFILEIPNKLKILGKTLLSPMYGKTISAFKNASGITGITEEFVDWGINKATRIKNIYDKAFPLGYEKKKYSQIDLNTSNEFWDMNGISKSYIIVAVVCYIGEVLDMNLLIKIAEDIENKRIKCKIFVCGVGPYLEKLKERTRVLESIHLMGWVNGCQIQTLLSRATLGFIPYKNRVDFMKSIPNKVPEYMSEGLPVVSSLKGVVQDIIRINNCGYYVDNANEFIKIIEDINIDPSKNIEMGMNALKLYQAEFSSEVIYSKMCDYLVDIVERNNK